MHQCEILALWGETLLESARSHRRSLWSGTGATRTAPGLRSRLYKEWV
jgi:hypothetical protein